jgi:hypothetical protein
MPNSLSVSRPWSPNISTLVHFCLSVTSNGPSAPQMTTNAAPTNPKTAMYVDSSFVTSTNGQCLESPVPYSAARPRCARENAQWFGRVHLQDRDCTMRHALRHGLSVPASPATATTATLTNCTAQHKAQFRTSTHQTSCRKFLWMPSVS